MLGWPGTAAYGVGYPVEALPTRGGFDDLALTPPELGVLRCMHLWVQTGLTAMDDSKRADRREDMRTALPFGPPSFEELWWIERCHVWLRRIVSYRWQGPRRGAPVWHIEEYARFQQLAWWPNGDDMFSILNGNGNHLSAEEYRAVSEPMRSATDRVQANVGVDNDFALAEGRGVWGRPAL